MKTQKTLIELLDNIDSSYMSEIEKIEMAARAQRAEAISNSIVSIARSIKQFAMNTRNTLAQQEAPKGHQA
ncbi:hypothetical protein [Marinomonas algicola]|uniref:hypothetical protein n=1 Tax=Marinomonas algicola TaxID=2773454 RepID=UPI00174BE535|nr:hypothetical protein [Marinomonas algicola]